MLPLLNHNLQRLPKVLALVEINRTDMSSTEVQRSEISTQTDQPKI
jgi:hypothetical protein